MQEQGNIVMLEHVNLHQSSQQLSTLFYVVGMGLTRDPYLMVGLDNMWINIGQSQMHLPTRAAKPQRLRGKIGLVVPSLAELARSLEGVRSQLHDTQFSFEARADRIDVTCPWGNHFVCHAPDVARFGPSRLGMPYVAFDVPAGTAQAISRFYANMLGAQTDVETLDGTLQMATVRMGSRQTLRFVETESDVAPYDGHHIQIYIHDFDAPHRRLAQHGLISRETGEHEWRFINITDPEGGRVLFALEHEVRSIRHPMFGRTLVNRNAAQSLSRYVPGHDNLSVDALR